RELGELRQVAGRVARAVVRAAQRLVGEKLDPRHGDIDAARNEADDDDLAPRPDRLPRETDRLGPADDLERVVGAAVCQRPHGPGDVVALGLDELRRAARTRELEVPGAAVDGDDRRGAREPRAGHDLQPHTAAADHAYRIAAPDTRDVPYRAEPGDDSATEQGRLPERQLNRDLHRPGGGDDRVLGEARGHQPVLQRLAVRVQPARAVHQ